MEDNGPVEGNPGIRHQAGHQTVLWIRFTPFTAVAYFNRMCLKTLHILLRNGLRNMTKNSPDLSLIEDLWERDGTSLIHGGGSSLQPSTNIFMPDASKHL